MEVIHSAPGRTGAKSVGSLRHNGGVRSVLLIGLLGLLLTACGGWDLLTGGSNPLRVTLHHFEDQRPESNVFLVSFTLTSNVARFLPVRRYQELSCVLQDSGGRVVAVRQCGTGGLKPGQSYRQDLRFLTLDDTPVVRLQVLDATQEEPLANLNLRQAFQLAEIDPGYEREVYQGQAFQSAREWQAKVEDWTEREPATPGHLASLEGYRIGLRVSRELSRLPDIRNDKWKHCLVGAEIALIANVETAVYAGWYKERQDLVDGLADTEFDEADFDATRDGALQTDLTQPEDSPASPSEFPTLVCGYCPDLCELRWGNPYLTWNGRYPPG